MLLSRSLAFSGLAEFWVFWRPSHLQTREFLLGWGIHVNPWLIHVNVWQKSLQYGKAISLQLIKINGKKMTMRVDTLWYLRTFPFLDPIKFEFYLLILLSECHVFIFIALISINTCWILSKTLIKHYTFAIAKHLKSYLLQKSVSHSTLGHSLQ